MKILRFLFLLLVFLWGLSHSSQAQNQERILSYSSDITVQPNGKLTVTEKIRVFALGNQIRRGIYRTFPTVYKRQDGKKVSVGFKVLQVLRDGSPEPYHQEPVINGKVVYIGKSDHYLAPGKYTYTLTYETSRQVGFFDDHDELYWNVVGLDWGFPIDTVLARVHLPEGARVLQTQAFVGPKGSKEEAYKGLPLGEGNYFFQSTRGLAPHEGFTLALSWPKGFVHMPTTSQQFEFLVNNRLSLLIGVGGMILLMFYYIILFNKVGRDPKKGNVLLRLSPPDGISPASARYLKRMGFDQTTFTAALVGMAVKGFLHIREEEPGDYVLEKQKLDKARAFPEEEVLFAKLFSGTKVFELQQENHKKISDAINALKQNLKKRYQPEYFRTNARWLVPGITMAAIMLAVMIWDFFRNGLSPYFSDVGVAIATTVGFLDLFFIHIPFAIWLKAPTQLGRQKLDEIEGYHQYLLTSKVEDSREAFSPQQSQEIFERNLPYAIALDCADEWGKQFDAILKDAAQSDKRGAHYYPYWYLAAGDGFNFTSDFSHSLSHSFDSAISSASTPPGSSSSFSGGGFSGGGGGGGGGGGW